MNNNERCPVFKNMPQEKCSGCEVCVNICPVQALKMESDILGFKYPVLQNDRCVNCGKCSSVCPMLNCKKKMNDNEHYYGAYHIKNDVLLQSASGGMFTYILSEFKKIYPNGNVVGAIYGMEFKRIEHYMSTDDIDIIKMKGSKYFQSNKNDIYKKVRAKLNNDEAVLFTGTPCEVAALYRYLNNKYIKLWTIDFICKGCSSPKILSDYIEYIEDKYNSKVEYLNMRYKWPELDNWIPQFLKIKLKNGKSLLKEFYNTELGIGFQILQRDSCKDCPFREGKHYSDFTIGDLHGVNKESELYNHLGVSVVITNTIRSQRLWESYDKTEIIMKSLDKETIYSNNRNMIDSRSEILKKYLACSDSVTAVQKCIGIKEKIKMFLPVKLVRKITMYRREHKK